MTAQIHKDELDGKVPTSPKHPSINYAALSPNLLPNFGDLVDGDLARLMHPNVLSAYEEVYTNVAAGAPVRPPA